MYEELEPDALAEFSHDESPRVRDGSVLDGVAVGSQVIYVERLSDLDGCSQHCEINVTPAERVRRRDQDGDGLDAVQGVHAHPIGLVEREEARVEVLLQQWPDRRELRGRGDWRRQGGMEKRDEEGGRHVLEGGKHDGEEEGEPGPVDFDLRRVVCFRPEKIALLD